MNEKKLKTGYYVRTKNKGVKKIIALYSNAIFDGQRRIEENQIIKSSPDILELLKPQDLLYIDIDNGFEGGIVVPRIPETLNELNNYIKKIKSGELILKGVVTHEQLMERMFEVNK